MKKIIIFAIAACAALVSCSKNNSDTPSADKSTPEIIFSYEQNDVVKNGMTMTLTIDGKDYVFNQSKDQKQIVLTNTKGTIKFNCVPDKTKKYTEKQDCIIHVDISAVSIASDGSYAAIKTLTTHTSAGKGVKPEKVSEWFDDQAEILNFSKNYEVSSTGIVTIKE